MIFPIEETGTKPLPPQLLVFPAYTVPPSESLKLDSLIDKANDIIEGYYNHRASTINLWITYAPSPGNYVICVQNAIAPAFQKFIDSEYTNEEKMELKKECYMYIE